MAFILGSRNPLELPVGDKTRRQRLSSPLLSVSVGTAGADRNARFLERMGDAGRLRRVQSALFYDYNENTNSELWQRLRPKKGNGRDGTQVHMPKAIRTSDGFLLNPYAFGEYLGIINRDMEELLNDIRSQAHAKGQPPQLIVEFLGFGGHANLGLLLHRKIREAFPEARCLPILALPDDPTLQEWMRGELQEPTDTNAVPDWMRHGTWNSYESHLTMRQHEGCLVVDNAIDSSPNDNLAMGLATIEAAGENAMKSGSLSEAIAGIRINDRGWLGMNVVQRVLPSRRTWSFGFPMRRLRPVWGSDDELAVQVKMAVKQCLTRGSLLESWEDPDMPAAPGVSRNGHFPNGQASANGSTNGHAIHNSHNSSAAPSAPPVKGARVYVSVPLPPTLMKTLRSNVMRQLKAEGFEQQFGKVNICFGAANFPERSDENDSRLNLPESDITKFLKLSAKFLIFPVYLPYIAGRHLLFGGEKERQTKQVKAVAVSLYPIPGRVKRVDEILYGQLLEGVQEVETLESGIGTGVHTLPPEGGYPVPAETAETETPQPASNGAAHEILETAPEPDYAAEDVADDGPTAEAPEDAVQTEPVAPPETAALENGAVPGGAIG